MERRSSVAAYNLQFATPARLTTAASRSDSNPAGPAIADRRGRDVHHDIDFDIDIDIDLSIGVGIGIGMDIDVESTFAHDPLRDIQSPTRARSRGRGAADGRNRAWLQRTASRW
jgi:hypothetical protein